ncbi:MAG: SGNH/GDSL hydrolase family protein [Spirochaetales bacterium]|jgi:lysophospholipase L1-like esterase|nr:SGNH/GDSL hydrolase family protein [Spirochaetales bacterium]
MMKKRLSGILVLGLAALMLSGFVGCVTKGNGAEYDPAGVETLADSPLKGKTLYFLGSSITIGYGSRGVAFPHYLAKRNGCTVVVEAVSGTTLTNKNRRSYVHRLEFGSKFDKNADVDLFICQLSTNDTRGATVETLNLGNILGPSEDLSLYDTSTITGAMEYIIAYARKTWDCPVAFYSCSKRNDPRYGLMVDRLNELKEVWGIGVLDLWNDEDFNNITREERKLWLKDEIHPTKAGYLEWWTPAFERFLYAEI